MTETTEKAILAGGGFWECRTCCASAPASSRRALTTPAATSPTRPTATSCTSARAPSPKARSHGNRCRSWRSNPSQHVELSRAAIRHRQPDWRSGRRSTDSDACQSSMWSSSARAVWRGGVRAACGSPVVRRAGRRSARRRECVHWACMPRRRCCGRMRRWPRRDALPAPARPSMAGWTWRRFLRRRDEISRAPDDRDDAAQRRRLRLRPERAGRRRLYRRPRAAGPDRLHDHRLGVVDFLHPATIAVVAKVPLKRLRHAVPPVPTRSELWLSLLEQASI